MGSTAPTSHGEQLEAGALIGGDESGKGDYFGPLVVAMVRIGAGEAAELRCEVTRGSPEPEIVWSRQVRIS